MEHHFISDPPQTRCTSYMSRALDSSLTMSKFLSSKSDLGNRLLMQAEVQHRPTRQQHDSRMHFSSHGWEFPNNKHEEKVQTFDRQRSCNMDALLSQVGTWQGDFQGDVGLFCSEDKELQTRSGLNRQNTRARDASNTGPWG